MQKEYEIIQTDEYDGVQMQMYDAKYGLLSMNRGQNDVWYKRWCYPAKWSNGKSIPLDKQRPISVRIGGDKSEAIKTLETLLKQVKGE